MYVHDTATLCDPECVKVPDNPQRVRSSNHQQPRSVFDFRRSALVSPATDPFSWDARTVPATRRFEYWTGVKSHLSQRSSTVGSSLSVHRNFIDVQLNNLKMCYSAMRYTAMRYSATHYSAMRYSAIRYSAMRYSAIRYSAMRYSSIRYSATRYHHNTLSSLHLDTTWTIKLGNSTNNSASQQNLASQQPIGHRRKIIRHRSNQFGIAEKQFGIATNN